MTAAQAQPRDPEAREQPRRYGPWLTTAAVLLLVIGAGLRLWHWLADPQRFPLREVEVSRALHHITESELRAAIAPYLGEGMLAVDVDGIRESVETLPWVASAGVRRQWPGKLIVDIRERVAVARWGKQALLSDEDVVFTPAPATFPDGLPLLSGPDGAEHDVRARFQRVTALLAPLGLKPAELHMDQRHAWRAVLADGGLIQLGSAQGEEALERFARALPRIAAPADARIARVDLRYPNGFALAWEQPAKAHR